MGRDGDRVGRVAAQLPAQTKVRPQARRADDAPLDVGGLLEEVGALLGRTDAIYAESVANGDIRLALSAIREKRGCLELLGKVTGELDGAEHAPDPRPMFSLPDGSYPRVRVEIERDTAIDITPELPTGD